MNFSAQHITLFFFVFFYAFQGISQGPKVPGGLRCDLIEHTDRVFINGELSQISFDEIDKIVEPSQLALIESKQPVFSWITEDQRNNTMQTDFHIQIGTSPKEMEENNITNIYCWC